MTNERKLFLEELKNNLERINNQLKMPNALSYFGSGVIDCMNSEREEILITLNKKN